MSILGDSERVFDVTAPEIIVLRKLSWYRSGGDVSDRQWRDIVGVLKQQGSALDRQYMREIADAVALRDLLERALSEVGG